MFKRLYSMTLQSLVLSLRNSLIWVLFGTLIVMIVVVQFALPKGYSTAQTQYIYDGTAGKAYENVMRMSGIAEKYLLEDPTELKERISKDNSAVGLRFEGAVENPEITLLHQGKLNEQNLNVVRISLEKLINAVAGARQGGADTNMDITADTGTDTSTAVSPRIEVRFLREIIDPIPRNLAFVSILMVFEVLILGFLMVAVFLFQEKHDGSIRAYRVTPGDTFIYIASRTLAFLLIGIVYGMILVVFTIGFHINFLLLLAVTIMGSVLYTLLGMIIAVFFSDISEWFFIGMAALFINMAPVFSHEFPSFSPGWISWFPSHQILLCFDEIFFPSGKSLMIPILILLLEVVAVYVICHVAVNRKLMKEGRR